MGSHDDGGSRYACLHLARGIQWQPAIEAVRGSCPQAKAWRRRMVLRPAAEFAVETPAEAEIDLPAGWQRRRVTRMSLPHSLA
jgi:hypothetical protein